MKNRQYITARRIVSWAKWFVQQEVTSGDICVDATVGNGNDTLFLAECTGRTGKVYGFDIQTTAIEKTRQKLNVAGLLDRVTLIQDSHAHLDMYLESGTVKTVMFNLGYLPGGNPSLITKPESTLQSLRVALKLLSNGGLITVASYRGHPGALEEFTKVNEFLSSLNPKEFKVLRLEPVNQEHIPPVLFVIQRHQ